jgi:hypothetical protein
MWSEVLLLVIPLILWSLASGQLETLRISSTGVQIKTAIQKAALKPITLRNTQIHFENPRSSLKESLMRLNEIKKERPEALNLIVRTDEYYDIEILEQYIYELSAIPDFEYFFFFNKASSQPFLGGIAAAKFCRSLSTQPQQQARAAPDEIESISMSSLTAVLNGHQDFDLVRRLPGFISPENALRKGDDKRTALAKMDEIGTSWLPVVERTKLIGVVERSELAAGLLLDVVKALEGRANS